MSKAAFLRGINDFHVCEDKDKSKEESRTVARARHVKDTTIRSNRRKRHDSSMCDHKTEEQQ